MALNVNLNQIPQALQQLAPSAGTSPSSGSSGSFKSVLDSMINHVEQSRANADQLARDFISGDNEELHSVALASQRAELEFDLMLQIRNKAVSAYQEIMKMQV